MDTELEHRLAMYDPTDPCPHCDHPLGRDIGNIGLDFPEDIATYLGLRHQECPCASP